VVVEYRYLDIILLDNLIMNFIILWIVWKVLKNTAPIWRLWCSSFIGSMYAVLLLIPGFILFEQLYFKLVLSLVMMLIGFRIQTLKDFLKLLGFFYGITFMFGGAAFGFYYFFSTNIDLENGVFYIKNFPVKIILFSAVFIIMLYRWLWPLLQSKLNHHQLIYKVEVQFEGNCIRFDAFLDTGNELIDPISQCPVMVVEFDQIKPILPVDIQRIFLQSKDNNFEFVTQVMAESSWINRFRMVPFKAIGNSNGLLIAYRPDSARILINENWKEIKDVIIGICNQSLSSSSEYHALIQSQIIP